MFQSLVFIWPFIRKNKKRYITGGIAAALENIMFAIPSYFVGIYVDLLLQKQLTVQRIVLYLTICFISVVISYFAARYWTITLYGNRDIGQKYYQDSLVRFLLNRRQIFYEKYSLGDLLSRATNDVDYIIDLLSWGISLVMYSGSFVILFFVLMVSKGGLRFTLITLIPYLFLIAYSIYREREVEKRWLKRQKAFSAMNDAVLEGIEGVRNIRAFAQEEAFRKRFVDKTNEYTNIANAVSRLSNTYSLSTRIASLAVFVVTMSLGAGRVIRGEMTVGALISFQIFVTSLAGPLDNLAMNVNVLQNANTSSKRLKELFAQSDGMEDGREVITHFETCVFDQYSFRFPDSSFDTLDKISITIKKGQTIGVVGKTGSGKTAFLRQFLREFPAGTGTCKINGIDLSDIAPGGMSPILAYVHQDHLFFSGSIRENVAFSVDETSDEEILEALEFASFELDGELMREGLDTRIGEKGITLSGGQRQRLSIARAILRKADLLILDDSLSAVDLLTEKKIIRNLRSLKSDSSKIISSHRLSAVQDADFILVFQDGKIVETGSHEELMLLDGWYKEQFIHQEEL